MEVKVNEIQIPKQIVFNYEELKAELLGKVEMYTNLVYTDDQVSLAKADRAKLNKLKTALNDERIRREKEYMEPFNVFKAQVNDLIKIVDQPISMIDKQVKGYEEKKKADKRVEIGSMWSQMPDKPDWLVLNQIWDDRWLNASVKMNQIKDNMAGWIVRANNEMKTLQAMPDMADEAIDEYKRTLDINRAIAEGQRIAAIIKRREEEKAKAEERRKAEEAAKEMEKHMAPPQMEVPEQPVAAEIPEAQKTAPASQNGQWIGFKAFLTVSQALELKEFFQSRNIEFKPI